ncbi:MAG: methyltransferase, partial [Hoeflea sp. BRH_c9]
METAIEIETALAPCGPEKQNRRSGGRANRVAVRTAPLADNLRPIRAGMSGGQYSPLTQANVLRIHEAALDALETIGLSQAPPSGVEIMTGAGAILGDDGRIRFPRALVEDMLALANKDLVLFGRESKYDLDLSGTRVHYGTAGAAVHVVDVENRTYRESTARDLYDAARITHALDNVHFFQRAMVCRDVVDNFEMDINTIYACCAGTTKHVGTSFSDPSHFEGCMDLIHMIAGGEANWRARPFVSNSNCFVVPPMKFAEESCITMEKCIRAGMPVLLLSAGQAGATAPAPLATA